MLTIPAPRSTSRCAGAADWVKVNDVRGNGSGLVTRGLAGAAGAGLMIGPAHAAGSAGRWLLPGTVLAGIVGVLLCRLRRVHTHGPGVQAPAARALELAGRGAAAGVLAGAISDHLRLDLAGPAEFGGLSVLAVLTAAVLVAPLAGLRPQRSRTPALVFTVVVFATLALFVVACLAIAPAEPPDLVGAPGPPEPTQPTGVLVAALIAGFGLLGADAAGGGRATTVAVVVLVVGQLVIGAVLLYQLGPARLALSSTPLRDALAAADASALAGPVGLVAALAMAAVLYRLLATTDRVGTLAVLLGGALSAMLLRPTVAMIAAVILTLAASAVAGRGEWRDRRRTSDVTEPG